MKIRVPHRPTGFDPEIAFSHAVALANQGNRLGAEKIYRSILNHSPNHFPTLRNLTAILTNLGRDEESVRLLRKALNRESNSAAINTLLASTLVVLGRDEEALQRAERAIRLNGNLAEAHAAYAEALTVLGRYDEARQSFARAMELGPGRAHFYQRWGEIARWTADDPRLPALESLAQRLRSLAPSEQVSLHFALAKAYADCGDDERSFRHQVEGGALKRRTLQYDEGAIFRQWDGFCRAFDTEWIRRTEGTGAPSDLPLFIVGMPRSGTTLVEQILASHPGVQGLGEPTYFGEAIARICGQATIPGWFAQSAATWSDARLRQLGEFYLDAVQHGAPETALRVIDKMPGNFRFVGLIHAALPNARIIHTSRDSIDNCLSVFSLLFRGEALPFSYDLGELGRHYRAYEKMMAHWRNVLPTGVMIDVHYEDVVDDLEGQARRIIAYCGLEWNDACLEFHKNDRPVRTASHAQVRQPIYRSSVGRPRPPRELLLPLLEALGVD